MSEHKDTGDTVIFEDINGESSFIAQYFSPSDFCTEVTAGTVPIIAKPPCESWLRLIKYVKTKSDGNFRRSLSMLMDEMEAIMSEFGDLLKACLAPKIPDGSEIRNVSGPNVTKILGWDSSCPFEFKGDEEIPDKYKTLFQEIVTEDPLEVKKRPKPKESPLTRTLPKIRTSSPASIESALNPPKKKSTPFGGIKPKYVCHICKKGGWPSYHALTRHQLRSHVGKNGLKVASGTQEEKTYTCTQCQAEFATASAMYNHKRVKHGNNSYLCSMCGKNYTTNYQLKFHVQTKHDGIQTKCTKCGKQVKSISYHKKICSQTYPCDKCDKVFNYKPSLKDHIESVHDGIKHICSHCGSEHVTRRGLNKHLKDTCLVAPKSPQKPIFSCLTCGKKFSTQSGLDIHVQNLCRDM